MNKKGFVLTETLAVAVFLVTIFTFVYTAIIPLIGTYRDLAVRENDIDIVYKLYHIRKMIMNDGNESNITSYNVKKITCSDLKNEYYCNKLINHIELRNFELVYTKSINANYSNAIISNEMREYLEKYISENESTIILLDKNSHTVAHLRYFDE